MKKILLATLGGIIFFVMIITIVNYFDNKKIKNEMSKRKFLYEINEQNNWKVKKNTDKNILSQTNSLDDFNLEGGVFYDTIHNQIYVEVTDWNTPDSRYVDDEHKEWIVFDTLGKIIKKGKIDNLKTIPLKTIFYTSTESGSVKKVFYIEKYIKGKINWNSFNPIRGMGNPNSSSENIYSNGVAFINIVIKNDTIKFKTEADLGEFGINTGTFLYSLNDKNIVSNVSFFLIELKTYSNENGLYILYH